VPELLFYYDDTPEKVGRVQEILQQIAKEQEQPPVFQESSTTS
jgi:ribosome-binding factor A